MDRLAFSVKEAAAAIGVSPRTIVREIKRGHLRAVRVSRRLVIPADALAELLGRQNMAQLIEQRTAQQAGGTGVFMPAQDQGAPRSTNARRVSTGD